MLTYEINTHATCIHTEAFIMTVEKIGNLIIRVGSFKVRT